MPRIQTSFAVEDQKRFADFSGDSNPMHMDAVAARRTQAGGCVVHGVHGFLWILEQLAIDGVPLAALHSAKVSFTRFIRLDTPVSAVIRSDHAPIRLDLVQDGQPIADILLRFSHHANEPCADDVPFRAERLPAVPLEPDFASLRAARGVLAPPAEAAALAGLLFPRCVAALGAARVVSIGLLSSLVGMVAPGLRSIFSSLDLRFVSSDQPARVRYAVAFLDDRFRALRLDVTGSGFAGSVGAFMRFPPVAPPDLAKVEAKIAPDEFAGCHALVVGGSRGLGACAAKLFAAGGGSVAVTYRSGRSEAELVRHDIEARYGPGRCAILPYDTAGEPSRQLCALPGEFSHVYYFATGRIDAQIEPIFDRKRLETFVDFYVDGFDRLVRYMIARASGKGLHVFYPSSVFVQDRPRGMVEYAMAKAAGEILCRELERRHLNLKVSLPRLPRVLTDQTATVPPVASADPVEILAALLGRRGVAPGEAAAVAPAEFTAS